MPTPTITITQGRLVMKARKAAAYPNSQIGFVILFFMFDFYLALCDMVTAKQFFSHAPLKHAL